MHHACYLDSSICLQLVTTTICQIIYMILILFVDHEKINYNVRFFSKENIQILLKSMWNCQQLILLFQFQKMWMFQFQKIFIPQFRKVSMFQSQEIFILQFQKMPISKFQKITIFQTQFQMLIFQFQKIYGCVFEFFFFFRLSPPQT